VQAVWRPLIEWSRRRHLKYRSALEARELATPTRVAGSGMIVSAGV